MQRTQQTCCFTLCSARYSSKRTAITRLCSSTCLSISASCNIKTSINGNSNTYLTYMTCYSRRLCLSRGQKPPLEQSTTRRRISSDSHGFPESAQKLSFLSFVLTLTDAYAPFSGSAVFT